MRADPDVIGFTEVRNTDESKIAFRAANTGHLVLTTLHAADVHETFVRLFEMDIARSIISKGILCIIAQTLIRTLCKNCKIRDIEASEMAEQAIYKQNEEGCSECEEGIGGRTVISEVLQFDEDVISWIDQGLSPKVITEKAIGTGKLLPMKQVAKRKIVSGAVSEIEVINLIELKTELNADAEIIVEEEKFDSQSNLEKDLDELDQKLKKDGVKV